MTPPQDPLDKPVWSSKQLAFRIGLLAFVYFVSGKLGLALSVVSENVTLIWPPTGLAIACLLLYGPKLLPGVFFGAFALNLSTSLPVESALLIAIGNSGEAFLAYWLLNRIQPIDSSLPRLRDAIWFILLAGGVATTVSASVGVMSLWAGSVIPVSAASSAWFYWWMGDAMGAIVFGPIIMAWLSPAARSDARAWRAEEILFVIAVFSIAWLSLSGMGPLQHSKPYPIAFIVFPLLVWGATRFGLRGATFCTLVFILSALLGILTGDGLFKRDTIIESLVLLWLYANTMAVSGLTLTAFVREILDAHKGLSLAANVFQNMPTGMLIADPAGKVIAANPAYLQTMGQTAHDIIGKPLDTLGQTSTGQGKTGSIVEQINTEGTWAGEADFHRANETPLPTWTHISQAYSHDGKITHLITAVTDITERKVIEAQNRALAEHDILTGLPNRMLLADRLGQAIHFSDRHQCLLGVLFVDLDRFKVINDSLGHDVGDALLVQVAARLQECVRHADTVARQGGDEFVLLITEVSRDHELAFVSQKVLDALTLPFRVGEYTLNISATIGIAVYPRDGGSAGELLKHADLAMYSGKDQGAHVRFYSDDMDRQAQSRLSIEANLRRALEADEFQLHYQAKVDALTGELVGFEALLRWKPPQGAMIPPGEFIGIAEETGLILPIGQWVLHEALAQISRWQHMGFDVPRIAINVSSKQIWHGGFDVTLSEALRDARVAPDLLEVEVTESVFLRAAEDVATTMQKIHDMGISVAIDDFGTGYSSLGYLRRLPVSTLKLDRSFVMDLPHSKEAESIAKAVISLANGLGLVVVAEGVETQAQQKGLQALQCHQLQGYLFSKPIPASDCEALMTRLAHHKGFGVGA